MSGAPPGDGYGQRKRFHEIFVSSTSVDLARHRSAVRDSIKTLRQHPLMMEDFGAQVGDGTTVSTKEFAQSDLVLLLVAWRYGHVPRTETRSITELEYEEALRLAKDCLVFLADPATEESDDLFPFAQRDPDHAAQLAAFRARLKPHHVFALFTTPDDLAKAVTTAVSGWLQDHPLIVSAGAQPNPADAANPANPANPANTPEPRIPRDTPPPYIGDFVGRTSEVDQLLALLSRGERDSFRAALLGMAGMGKSALAARVVRKVVEDPSAYQGGIAYVFCGEQQAAEGISWVYDRLLAAWGAPLSAVQRARARTLEEAAAIREEALRERLRPPSPAQLAPGLVLLDDVSQQLPISGVVATLSALGVSVLLTARDLPGVSDLTVVKLGELDPNAALALFQARYLQQQGDWNPARDASPAREIVRLLGNLPLAIELAATNAALDSHGLAQWATQLAEHNRLEPLVDPTQSDRSVRNAFERSFERLTQPLRVAFAALGLPAGADWPREIITTFLARLLANTSSSPGASSEPPAADMPDMPDVLPALASHALVALTAAVEDDDRSTPRVRLHPQLREYASVAFAKESPERQSAAASALLEAVAEFISAHSALGADQFALLAREETLITAALQHAADLQIAPATLATAVNNLANYIDIGAHWQTGVTLRLLQLRAYQALGDPIGQQTTLNNMALLAHSLGQPEAARAYYEQALAIHREVGNRTEEGTTLNNLGELARSLGQMEAARGDYEQALAIQREVGDRAGEGATLNNLGYLAQALGHREAARDYYEQALTIRREVGDRAREGVTLNNLGDLVDALGEMDTAGFYYEQALAITREVGNRAMEGTTLNNLGYLARSQGQPEAARGYYEQALAIFQDIRDVVHVRGVTDNLADLARATASTATPAPDPAPTPTAATPATPDPTPPPATPAPPKRHWWSRRR